MCRNIIFNTYLLGLYLQITLTAVSDPVPLGPEYKRPLQRGLFENIVGREDEPVFSSYPAMYSTLVQDNVHHSGHILLVACKNFKVSSYCENLKNENTYMKRIIL